MYMMCTYMYDCCIISMDASKGAIVVKSNPKYLNFPEKWSSQNMTSILMKILGSWLKLNTVSDVVYRMSRNDLIW